MLHGGKTCPADIDSATLIRWFMTAYEPNCGRARFIEPVLRRTSADQGAERAFSHVRCADRGRGMPALPPLRTQMLDCRGADVTIEVQHEYGVSGCRRCLRRVANA